MAPGPKTQRKVPLAWSLFTRGNLCRRGSGGKIVLNDKPLASISEADLQYLLGNKVREGKDIEYKRSFPGNAESDKKEFLADVSSFANTNGGHLIYGIEETGGVPTAIPGLTLPDLDAAIQRLDNLIRDGLQPRLTGVQIEPVPLASGAHAPVFRQSAHVTVR